MFAKTQTMFARSLHPRVPEQCLQHAARSIRQHGTLSNEQRLMIYRNNVTASLISALKDIYPVIDQILGETFFYNLAKDYVWLADASNPDLNLFGHDFPVYLRLQVHNNPVLKDFPYLPDLASLECAWHAAYYADDDPCFDFERLAEQAHSGTPILLRLSHSLSLLTSEHPILKLWKLHRYRNPPEILEGLKDQEYYCIYRKHYTPDIIRVGQTDFHFLEACMQGRNMNELASNQTTAASLSKLPMFIKHGWICDLEAGS